MTQLDWQDDSSNYRPGYRADYKGLVIKAVHDSSPNDPFEEWDGHWPMVVYYDRTTRIVDEFSGPGPHDPIAHFNDPQLVTLQKNICKELGVDHASLFEGWQTDANELRSGFEQLMGEFSQREMLDECEKLYGLLKIPCLRTTSRGYCQGDRAELLIVATPEAVDRFGIAPERIEASLKAQEDLYSAWAWGDVYGWVIETPDGDELDSCWGYYGDEFDKSGLEESALDSADRILADARRRKQSTLKELIRNHVPLSARIARLSEAARLCHG